MLDFNFPRATVKIFIYVLSKSFFFWEDLLNQPADMSQDMCVLGALHLRVGYFESHPCLN